MAPLATNAPDYLGFGYAVLLALGGLAGAARKGSIVSLLMGVVSGAIAAHGAKRVSQDKHDVYVSLGITTLLTLVMGYRFSRRWKFMPAGLVCVLSAAMSVYYTLVSSGRVSLERTPL
ncbi:transmembrane proteins 14C-domain-containing protein [Papiliotrema laurentii]|uniref:Transmembrane proteins 14C-domain-containing protein n=1 Tax=Papiliotrema laurentii TaxID=5418 RepID=A0AAD9FUF7_PAPLA|nr:transmembrane proteins 14C-domain-containing protein [Papiliotrema laurentii]